MHFESKASTRAPLYFKIHLLLYRFHREHNDLLHIFIAGCIFGIKRMPSISVCPEQIQQTFQHSEK